MSLQLRNIRLPLVDFALETDGIFDQPITGIFGPSGAGKTSLLDLIAGLRRPVAGAVQLDDKVIFDAADRLNLPPRLRRIGYVPQDLALFPHLKVRANLLYGYRPALIEDELFTLGHVAEVMEITPLARTQRHHTLRRRTAARRVRSRHSFGASSASFG